MLPRQVKLKNKIEHGFSLIELMIAMTLGLLLLTGVIQIFLSSKQAYGTVSGASQTLDNGRLSVHFLKGAVGKAGYWGDPTIPRSFSADTSITVNHTGATNAPYSDSYTGVFEDGAYISGLNNDTADANVINGTDQLWLRYNGHDTLPIFNCAGQSVSSTLVAVERYYISEPGGSERLPSLVCETTLMDIDKATGIVTAQPDPIITTQVLISGVENMQILFGEINTGFSQLNYHTANDVTNWFWVHSVRIAVLAASADEVNSVKKASGYSLLDVTTATPTDTRARRVFEQTVALRNSNF